MKNNTVFVDTGAWFALADRSDQYHSQAVNVFPELLNNYHHLSTTNLVIAEAYVLIRLTIGHQPAVNFLTNIAASPRILKIYSDRTLEEEAENILVKYNDQAFSYTDAVSFALMKRFDIKEAFSFDRHFAIAGFVLMP